MSQSDRELLEMAAKAAGVNLTWIGIIPIDNTRDARWNPLYDDGAALRLAVKLDICLRLDSDELTGIAHWRRKRKTFRVVGDYTGQEVQARLLIVRAAAEIGKSMP